MDVIHRNISRSFLDASGNPVVVHGWRAKKGYDLASGLGTVDAAQFVPGAGERRGHGFLTRTLGGGPPAVAALHRVRVPLAPTRGG